MYIISNLKLNKTSSFRGDLNNSIMETSYRLQPPEHKKPMGIMPYTYTYIRHMGGRGADKIRKVNLQSQYERYEKRLDQIWSICPQRILYHNLFTKTVTFKSDMNLLLTPNHLLYVNRRILREIFAKLNMYFCLLFLSNTLKHHHNFIGWDN